MLNVHTGFWWFDVIVYAVSGGALVGIIYTLPGYYRNVIKPHTNEIVRLIRESRKQNQ